MATKRTAPREPTRGEKVIYFIEHFCRVPEGKHVGQPMKLAPFQRKWILDVYDNPHGTRRAYLSIARKNGKTGLIAAILLAHIVGPEAVLNSQIISGANSRDQAALVFKLAVKMIDLSDELRPLARHVPSSKTIYGLHQNVEYRAISAEGSTAHGLSPIVAVLDEVGQVKGPQSDFIDAITTSQGAHDSPLLIAISTQAAEDNDLFSIWLDDAAASNDPRIVCHLYAAEKDCDLDDELQWHRANPALGMFRSMEDVREQAAQALRMPTSENTFRWLTLNQRVQMDSPFVSRSVWMKNALPPKPLGERPIYGGLDLSSVADLTAFVMVARDDAGAWDVEAKFWLPGVGLHEKAKQDRVPYPLWEDQGYLTTTPSASIEYEYVAHYLRELFDQCDIQKIAFDRYNWKHLEPWLRKVGFVDWEIERFIPFGQGIVSMSPALRTLESLLLGSKLRHGDNPILTWCAANAVVEMDAAGNRKFAKNRSTGRIDGMVALAQAVAVASESAEEIITHDAPCFAL